MIRYVVLLVALLQKFGVRVLESDNFKSLEKELKKKEKLGNLHCRKHGIFCIDSKKDMPQNDEDVVFLALPSTFAFFIQSCDTFRFVAKDVYAEMAGGLQENEILYSFNGKRFKKIEKKKQMPGKRAQVIFLACTHREDRLELEATHKAS